MFVVWEANEPLSALHTLVAGSMQRLLRRADLFQVDLNVLTNN
jgi:hypothetical protein